MTTPSTTPLADRGFVHVLCNECGNADVWLRCESCNKSDHFLLQDGTASCDCGATWTHASCLCGARVPPSGRLDFVEFGSGPMALADLEIDKARLGALVLVAMVGLAGLVWAFVL